MMKRSKGSITVFASLLLLLLLAILCTTLESARIAGIKAVMATASDAAGFSLFSEYNNKLLEEYELFFLEDCADLEDQLKEYVSYYENPLKGLSGIYGSNYYPFEVESISIEKMEKALDNNASCVEQEMISVMKNVEVKEILSKITSSLNWTQKADKISSYMEQWMKKSDDIVKLQDMVSNTYKKCTSIRDSYEELKDRINMVKNNIEEYDKSLGNQELMDTYQSQLSVSISNVNTQKAEVIGQLTDTKTYVDDYIKKSEVLNQSLLKIEEVDELEQKDFSQFISQQDENLKKMQTLSSQGKSNLKLLEQLGDMSISSDIQKAKREVTQWEENLKSYQSMAIEKTETTSANAKDFDLLKTVKQVMSDGVLALVVENMDDLSKREFKTTNFPSKEAKITKTQTSTLDKTVNSALLNEYLLKYMLNYRTSNAQELRYDLEYIIGGKTSDKENLTQVVNRLVSLRQAMNYVYLLSDTEKKTMAREMAMAVLGVVSVTAVAVPVVTQLILMAWAYAESICDVKALLGGEKVSFVKTKTEWNLSLESASKGSKNWKRGKSSNSSTKGLDYTEYLRILLYLQTRNSKIYRALDMIQLQISKEDTQFQIKNCIYNLEADATLKAKSMFLSLPLVQRVVSGNIDNYVFHTKISYTYQ